MDSNIPTKTGPFLKWAGGKTQLLSQFRMYYPPELKSGKIRRCVEPFLGGSAVFFDIAQRYQLDSAYLSDVNEELILVYSVVQRDPEKLIDRLGELRRRYFALDHVKREQFYYTTRSGYNEQRNKLNFNCYGDPWITRAAHMIFLNKTCYNGLYRVNSKGAFNVPFGRYKKPAILNENRILEASRLLQIAELAVGAYQECERYVDDNTFVYFDPPYRPLSPTSNFTSYSIVKFDDEAQMGLGRFFRELDRSQARMMLSNSDPHNIDPSDSFFDDLYSGFQIHRVCANRMINSDIGGRGKISELLISNY